MSQPSEWGTNIARALTARLLAGEHWSCLASALDAAYAAGVRSAEAAMDNLAMKLTKAESALLEALLDVEGHKSGEEIQQARAEKAESALLEAQAQGERLREALRDVLRFAIEVPGPAGTDPWRKLSSGRIEDVRTALDDAVPPAALLAAHDRGIRAQAWDEGESAGRRNGENDGGLESDLSRNPYREPGGKEGT